MTMSRVVSSQFIGSTNRRVTVAAFTASDNADDLLRYVQQTRCAEYDVTQTVEIRHAVCPVGRR